jgi:hypothetical protein
VARVLDLFEIDVQTIGRWGRESES